MIERAPNLPAEPAHDPLGEHLIGRYDSGRPGTFFLVIGGVHGNEPGGVIALERVLAELRAHHIPFTGKLLALKGNVGALAARRRYLDEDLNRLWDERDLADLLAREAGHDSAEEREARELHAAFTEALREAGGRLVVLDLHSSSAEGRPFSIMADTLQNRRIAFALPVPVILGLEENLDGTILGLFGRLGQVCIAVEGGQHDDPCTADYLEAAVWAALVAGGGVRREDVPRYDEKHGRLEKIGRGLPRVLETRYRHPLEVGHDFRMVPGFTTFAPIKKGDLLAHEAERPISAPESGVLLLPLYQGQGSDGFFLGRRVGRMRLWLSQWLRHLRLEHALTLLPGIKRAERPDVLVADLRIARFLAPEVFNLLGYRGRRLEGQRVLFTRRLEGSRIR